MHNYFARVTVVAEIVTLNRASKIVKKFWTVYITFSIIYLTLKRKSLQKNFEQN